MHMTVPRHIEVGEAKFPIWSKAKQLIEGMAQGLADGGSHAIGP